MARVRTVKKRKPGESKSFLERLSTDNRRKPENVVQQVTGVKNLTYLSVIYNLALLGATDEIIARSLGMSLPNFNVMKKREDVAKTLKEGRVNADMHVANAMYHAAIGYSHPDEVIISNRVKEFDEYGRVVREYNDPIRLKTIKHYPPNAKLIMRWLQVRQPEIWADKRAEINNNITNIMNISANTLSNEELALMSKLGLDNSTIGNGNFMAPEIVHQEFNENIEDDFDEYEEEGTDENEQE